MGRTSGVLLHISSLPNKYGIGDFGQSALDFVDFLVETEQQYWQILPLTTTSFGDSPYQSFSAFAGNTHFIDFDQLIDFKLKPPYLPNVKDVQIELNENNLFDNMIQEDKTILTRKEGDDIPPDYNRKWADEF